MASDILNIFEDANENRREYLEARLENVEGMFSPEDLAEPLPPFRDRVPGESIREYRDLEYLYFQNFMDERWDMYLNSIDDELIKQHDYGGMAGVANQANRGWFEIPEELYRYDIYMLMAASAITQYAVMPPIPVARMPQIESSIWRASARAGDQLSTNPLWAVNDSVKRQVNDGVRLMLEEGGFGRGRFIELLRSPLEGTSPITGSARARMIARTEATRARADMAGEWANLLRSQGYQVLEIWRISGNTNVCPECEELNGRIRGQGWLDYPPLHPNCDCDIEIEEL